MEATMEEQQEDRNGKIQPAGLSTIEELAQFLQVKKSWIYGQTRVAKRTGFPVVRCGKYVRFKLDDVLRWLNNGSKTVAR
jgi:excisionase family DNA binding protein